MGFAIFNGKRQYIPRVWVAKLDAMEELRDMLSIYPAHSPWRKKLSVREVKVKSEKARQKAA